MTLIPFIQQYHLVKFDFKDIAYNKHTVYKSLIITLLLILFVFSISRSGYSQKPIRDTAVVALVNGEHVMISEFMLLAQKERSEVIRFYLNTYDCEFNNTFWSKPFDGISPSDMLKEKTLDTLVKIKIQQICARNVGIMNDISYSGFIKALEIENKRRLEAMRSNKVIYGPVQYSEEVYYSYTFTNIVNKLKSILAEKIFIISDDTLKNIYEADKNSLYQRGYYTKIKLVGIKPKEGPRNKKNVGPMNVWHSELVELSDGIFKNDSSIEFLNKSFINDSTFSLFVEDIIYNDSVYSPEEENTIRAKVKESSKALQKGESSPVLEFSDSLYIFQIIEKHQLGYRSFDDCKRAIRESLTDQLYMQYMNAMFMKAHVEIKPDIMMQIHF